ncbi:hypothetical protein MSUIS_05630 [Mycoplasma suis KI3806]|uniref:Uncharacterized protein n=1 Tax=Mycoplasma suis (strain KI_3806) TaxID=708248 RepID=F0V1X5_MYCS3|nr:hypothetical protein MSUIS_05630 [Mycoplasma suis KI3806]
MLGVTTLGVGGTTTYLFRDSIFNGREVKTASKESSKKSIMGKSSSEERISEIEKQIVSLKDLVSF